MQEIWKDVKGYEGLYQVSNFGRIKSLPRNTKNQYKNGIIKQNVIRGKGYYYINLYNKGTKLFTVHKLVAETFIPNPSNLPCINHIDGNKLNNKINNLEWCSYSDNEMHAYKHNLKTPLFKKVNQYDLDGNFIKTWNSIEEANNFYKTTHISECCNDKSNRKIAKGYLWRYADK